MGSSGLPFPTSNNAPLPVPGGYGNPAGANTGGFSGSTGQPFPTMPAFGGINPSMPSYNAGPWTGTNLQNLNPGLMAYGQGYGTDLYNRLGRAYGRGAGQLLGNILSGGLYNPQVAAAYLNAQQPGIARGEAGVLGAFGDAGARFSSAAALGLGDYESQVQLNQQQMLAQLYQNAQQQELGVLQGVLPTLQQERANEGGWLNTILGGAEIAGGIAIDAVTAGMGGNMLIAAGANTMSKGHGSKQGGATSASPYAMMPGGGGLPGFGGNTGALGPNAPSWQQFPQANPSSVAPPTLPSTDSDVSSYPYMNTGPNLSIPQILQINAGNAIQGSQPQVPTDQLGSNTFSGGYFDWNTGMWNMGNEPVPGLTP